MKNLLSEKFLQALLVHFINETGCKISQKVTETGEIKAAVYFPEGNNYDPKELSHKLARDFEDFLDDFTEQVHDFKFSFSPENEKARNLDLNIPFDQIKDLLETSNKSK